MTYHLPSLPAMLLYDDVAADLASLGVHAGPTAEDDALSMLRTPTNEQLRRAGEIVLASAWRHPQVFDAPLADFTAWAGFDPLMILAAAQFANRLRLFGRLEVVGPSGRMSLASSQSDGTVQVERFPFAPGAAWEECRWTRKASPNTYTLAVTGIPHTLLQQLEGQPLRRLIAHSLLDGFDFVVTIRGVTMREGETHLLTLARRPDDRDIATYAHLRLAALDRSETA